VKIALRNPHLWLNFKLQLSRKQIWVAVFLGIRTEKELNCSQPEDISANNIKR
jgi:hypothetical protein